MTLEQIMAIVYLLYAFGVPQPTVNTVQAILINSVPVRQEASVGAPAEVAPLPRCVLRGEVYSDPLGNKVGRIHWTSTNAQKGTLLGLHRALAPVTGGSLSGLTLTGSTTFKALFSDSHEYWDAGNTTTCEVTI